MAEEKQGDIYAKPRTDKEIKYDNIVKHYKEKTDRELLEEQTYLAQLTADNTSLIKGMVAAWWWIVGLLIVSYILYLFVNR